MKARDTARANGVDEALWPIIPSKIYKG